MFTSRSRGIESTEVCSCSGSKRTSRIVSLCGGSSRSKASLDRSRRSEPSTRNVCGPPLYCGVISPLGALMWLTAGNTSAARPLTVLRVTVAVAPALKPTISTAAIRKRFHIAHHRAGARSSSMDCSPRRLAARQAHARARHTPRRRLGSILPVLSARNRELLGLIPAALLVTGGFTAIFVQQQANSPHAATSLTLNHASGISLTYGLLFLDRKST